MKYFMLDIESMGTDFESDDIIQIALLEVDYAGGEFYPGRCYQRSLYTSQKPKNDWIANTHKDLLKVCRNVPMVDTETIRQDILGFFKFCGVDELAMLMGLNLATFDVPYLVHKNFLKKPTQDANNKLCGDYHYRLYELKGAYNLARDVLNVDEKKLKAMVDRVTVDIEMPEGKAHEALYDCYGQLRMLNGIMRLLRSKYNQRAV